MKKADKGQPPSAASGGNLLGDLESIRTLLDEEEKALGKRNVEDTSDAEDVPMLQDVIDGALQVDESPLTGRAELSMDNTAATLGDDTIKALLGDEWKSHAADIISKAREGVDEGAARWSPEQTDELGKALKVRLDSIVDTWLSQIVAEGIDELREQLLHALDAEVTRHTKGSNDPDGS